MNHLTVLKPIQVWPPKIPKIGDSLLYFKILRNKYKI